MWVPFLRSFPGNEAHKLFSGGPKWGVLGGGQKVYVEKVDVLCLSPKAVEGLKQRGYICIYIYIAFNRFEGATKHLDCDTT